MSNFKTKFCFWPVRLAHFVDHPESHGLKMLKFVGWVWMQRAHLTNNRNHGWICILGSKEEPPRCNKCGQVIPEADRCQT